MSGMLISFWISTILCTTNAAFIKHLPCKHAISEYSNPVVFLLKTSRHIPRTSTNDAARSYNVLKTFTNNARGSYNVLRTSTDEAEGSYKEEMPEGLKAQQAVMREHKRKMKEIVHFLRTHHLSTNYFYEEMNRIKKQGRVKDVLRRMVEVLETPKNEVLKKAVLKCYFTYRPMKHRNVDVFKYKPNNLVISVDGEPFQTGVYR